MRQVYLDHSATTPVRKEVLESIEPFFTSTFGNPSSIHTVGQNARRAVWGARERIADTLGCTGQEIVFTSCGTESNNLAIKGTAMALKERGKHIVTTAIEHYSVLNTCRYLEELGFEVTYLPVDETGLVSSFVVAEAIRPDTILITIMMANNEVGTIEPIMEIGRLARDRGIPFHTDAVQAFGKIPVDVRNLPVDLLSISGHKIHGPKGSGCLYIRGGTRLTPILHGGHHERELRAGTENVPAIVGLAVAVELAEGEREVFARRVGQLRDTLQEEIRKTIPDTSFNGHPVFRLPHILNMSFDNVEGESLLLSLDLKGIALSSGSACTSGAVSASHVLIAMGIAPKMIHGSLRFSLGMLNTVEDIDYLLEVLPPAVSRLREMSPTKKREENDE